MDIQTRLVSPTNQDEDTLNLLCTLNSDHDFADFFLNAEEKAVIHSYTGLAHEPINFYLYDNEKFMETRLSKVKTDEDKAHLEEYLKLTRKRIEILDRAFSKVAPIRERRLFRSVRLPGLAEDDMGTPEQLESYLANTFPEDGIVQFPSYLSTSIDASHMITRVPQNEENAYFVLEVRTNKGIVPEVTVINEEPGHIQENEREVLLPRDMKFRVKSVDKKTRFIINPKRARANETREYMNCYTVKLEEVENDK